MNLSKNLKRLIIALNVLIIFFMALIITVGAGYTVLVGDDFTNGVRIGAFHVSFFEYLGASFDYVKSMYMDWQGPYFAMFIQAFLSPVNNFGLVQLRVVMMANALFFMGSLLFMVWSALDYVLGEQDKKLHVRLTIFSVILFSILDSEIFTEIFFWYCGATAYCMPLSVLQISVGLFLLLNKELLNKKKKNVLTAASALTLFLAAGGTLAITGAGCYIILLLTVGFYLVSKKISVRNIIVMAAGIIGALINVAAPGNYARHSESAGEGFLLFKAVKWTIKNVCAETERLTKETLFGVMIVVMILMGVYLSDRVKRAFASYGIVSVLALMSGFVVAFPVAFGYGGPYFPNRCYFILDVVLVVSILNFAVFIGCCLDRWSGLHESKSSLAVLVVVVFAMLVLSKETMEDSAFLTVAKSVNNGSYHDYYGKCVSIYDYLENCPEEDVVLEMPEYIDNFECFYFDEDENGWVNIGIAQYYHKNSVKRASQ
ncbi:MAG: hypothetical protein K2J99_07255 [Lachnospiraceae bacterium]|nr:hypothetical protein [Lachnospiraceae bacterium]